MPARHGPRLLADSVAADPAPRRESDVAVTSPESPGVGRIRAQCALGDLSDVGPRTVGAVPAHRCRRDEGGAARRRGRASPPWVAAMASSTANSDS